MKALRASMLTMILAAIPGLTAHAADDLTPPRQPTPIQFERNHFSTLIHDRSGPTYVKEYVFRARSGQMLTVALVSERGEAEFILLYARDGDQWQSFPGFNIRSGEGRTLWQGALPRAHGGRYMIIVHTPERRRYDLFVGIQP